MIRFSKSEERIIKLALITFSIAVTATIIFKIISLLISLFQRFSYLLLPLITSFIIALVIKPYHEWLIRKLKVSRITGTLLTFISILLPIGVLSWISVGIIIKETTQAVLSLTNWWQQLDQDKYTLFPKVHIFFTEHPLGQEIVKIVKENQEKVTQAISKLGEYTASTLVHIFSSFKLLLGWAITPLYVAYILNIEFKKKLEPRDLLPIIPKEINSYITFMATELVKLTVGFFRGQLIIAIIQALLYSLAFYLAGIKYGFLIGVITGILNIVPFLGSSIGFVLMVLTGFFQDGGGIERVTLGVVAFGIVQIIESYIITPKIMGNKTGLHPLAIIIALLFWPKIIPGLTGVILAIPLTAFLVSLWDFVKSKDMTKSSP